MNEWLTVMTSSPGPTPTASERQVQRRRAARDGAGMRRADGRGELALEGRDFRALRDPSRQDRAARGLGVALVEPGSRDGDQRGRSSASHRDSERRRIQLRTTSCSSSSSGVFVLIAIPLAAGAAGPRTATLAARTRAARARATTSATSRRTSPGRGRSCSTTASGRPATDATVCARSLIVTSLPLPRLIVSPDGLRMLAGQQDAVRRVAHVREVARLRAVAEDDHRPAGETAQQELRNDFPAVALVMRPRPVGIERPDDDRRIAVGAEVRARVALARQLRAAVDGARERRVILGHRSQRMSAPTARRRTPPSSTRRRTAARRRARAGRQQLQRRRGVHLVVLVRRVHRMPHAKAREVIHGPRLAQMRRQRRRGRGCP